MDSKRHFDAMHLKNYNALLAYKLSVREPYDAIISSDDNALNFLKEHKEKYFPNTPLFFFGVNNITNAKQSAQDISITGLVEAISIGETISLSKRLNKNVKNLYVIADKRPSSLADLSSFKRVSKEFSNLEVKELLLEKLSFSQLQKKLEGLSSTSDAVFLLSAYTDALGAYKNNIEYTRFIAKHSNAPVYLFWDFGLGLGVVGGKMISLKEQAKTTAKNVLAYFHGKPMQSFTLSTQSPNIYMFDYKVLEKFDIALNGLPLKSQLINRPSGFYEENKAIVNSIGLLFAVFFVVIIVLLVNVFRRKEAERQLSLLNDNLENQVVQRTKDLENSLKQLKSAQKQLIYSEKMASLGALVAGVAHEINTPIGMGVTGITHFLHINKKLREQLEEDELTREYLEEYLNTSLELAEIINANMVRAAEQVRSFKQVAVDQSSEHKREFNLKNYIKETLLSLQNHLKKTKHTINLECPNDLVINSYPGAFSQIFTNFIMNSLIHGFEKDDTGIISIEVKTDKSELILIYKDNGKGITESLQNKVFDPFFTTNRKKGGSGLGLNIVYNIVTNQLKGEISLQSCEKKGVEFIISLKEMI